MKLWILKPKPHVDWPNYDAYFGHVVRAETEEEAREFCLCGDEGVYGAEPGCNPWLDSTKTTCQELTQNGASGVVLSDFNAG